MQYSNIKGYQISKLTLGTVALGLDYGVSNAEGKPETEDGKRILAHAYESGIHCLDTASSYGSAEDLIGTFIREAQPEEIVIVTKFRWSAENLEHPEAALAIARESVNASRQKLAMEKIPVCLFHMDRDLPREAVKSILPAVLETLKAEGLIGLGGISIDHPGEAADYTGHPSIDALQVPVNIFDQRLVNSGIIRRMHQAGQIVFARSVFLQGLFFLQPDTLSGNLCEAKEYLELLQGLARKEGISVAQLAFSYVRDLEGVHSLVFGAHKLEQVEENIALLGGAALSENTRILIRQLFGEMPEIVITPRDWKK